MRMAGKAVVNGKKPQGHGHVRRGIIAKKEREESVLKKPEPILAEM